MREAKLMGATKNHISLETAKLLDGCGVDSRFAYYRNPYNDRHFPVRVLSKHPSFEDKQSYLCPAYTWQEILWEYPGIFFGHFGEFEHAAILLSELQLKQYDEADLYFRENCVLIKDKA